MNEKRVVDITKIIRRVLIRNPRAQNYLRPSLKLGKVVWIQVYLKKLTIQLSGTQSIILSHKSNEYEAATLFTYLNSFFLINIYIFIRIYPVS